MFPRDQSQDEPLECAHGAIMREPYYLRCFESVMMLDGSATEISLPDLGVDVIVVAPVLV